ncbi:MAG: type II toxin-antitoxin system VapC family toxin [Candidatus Omnitrophica bacterium]|nr:type II toxin-antitoxin system VapC family toxin [Candidatus Omnitrophota bacterium]
MSWCLNEETVETSSKILKSIIKNEIVVPCLWVYEVTNTLTTSVRRNKLSVAETHHLINDIQLLPIEFDKPTIEDMFSIFNIANEHKLSAYDAAYIELALRTNTPIASFDKDVIKVAKKLGIKIFNG